MLTILLLFILSVYNFKKLIFGYRMKPFPLMGPVMLDLMALELSAEERDLLNHPLVGGVILFTRNYASVEQMQELCQQIRECTAQPLLIAVDQEGGRVQRFHEPLTLLPAMEQIGEIYDFSAEEGVKLANTCGWLMAAELLSLGIDLSFAPVLDLNKGLNPAIGNRAFHRNPLKVAELANSLMQGMLKAGMTATGKHFPGHGTVALDSHFTLPLDDRRLADIMSDDLLPFLKLIQSGINAIMPALIVFPAIDTLPVVYSPFWIQTILKDQLKFQGMIFSDDLNMQGASIGGNYFERAKKALDAGCDMILICNNRQAANDILKHLPYDYFIPSEKYQLLQGKFSISFDTLQTTSQWQSETSFLMKTLSYYEKKTRNPYGIN